MIVAVVFFAFVSPTYAVDTSSQERLLDIKEKRMEKVEEKLEKVSSRPGVLRGLFAKAKAVIGTGTLTAKSGTVLTVEKDGKSYTVNTDSNTKLVRRFWGKSSLDEMNVGDTVNVIGIWADDAHTVITAKLVRDVSIQKRFGVFIGEVKSLLSDGWIMTTKSDKRADQTVTVSSSTKFENRKEESITKDQIQVGHRVRIKGLWNKTTNTVTEVKEVKDFTLPVKVSATAATTITIAPEDE